MSFADDMKKVANDKNNLKLQEQIKKKENEIIRQQQVEHFKEIIRECVTAAASKGEYSGCWYLYKRIIDKDDRTQSHMREYALLNTRSGASKFLTKEIETSLSEDIASLSNAREYSYKYYKRALLEKAYYAAFPMSMFHEVIPVINKAAKELGILFEPGVDMVDEEITGNYPVQSFFNIITGTDRENIYVSISYVYAKIKLSWK